MHVDHLFTDSVDLLIRFGHSSRRFTERASFPGYAVAPLKTSGTLTSLVALLPLILKVIRGGNCFES